MISVKIKSLEEQLYGLYIQEMILIGCSELLQLHREENNCLNFHYQPVMCSIQLGCADDLRNVLVHVTQL